MAQLPGQDTSIWRATGPARTYPRLEGAGHADVIVVGAGITGLTTALLLKEAGARVVVIEAERLGHGTTGGTTGKVTSQHGLLYADLIEQKGEDAARAYAEANENALSLVQQIARRYELDADLVAADAYVYTEQPGQAERMHAELEAAQRLGLPASWAEETELPFPIVGAVRFERQLQLHAVKYLHALAVAVDGGGSSVHEQTRALDVVEGGQPRVITEHGTLRADHVVLATLLPILDRGFEFARTHPSRAYGIAARIDGETPVGMYISAESPTRSFRPYRAREDNYLIVVGNSHKTGQEPDTGAHYEALVNFARERFPVSRIDYRWSAQDYMPVDNVPYIGKVAFGGSVYVATGLKKWGLSNGTAAAEIIADSILSRGSRWAEVFSTTRLEVIRSVRELLQHNVDSAKRFAGDRFRSVFTTVADIPPGGGGVVLTGGEQVAVAKDEGGRTTAVSAVCRHLGCIVQWNPAEQTWDCPCHGSRYDRDGRVLTGPATRSLEPREL
ncbi:MAG: FAD-dependent oxidoreductase [Actinomycetota bacterium]|nr:FAD-dependent oxidoreductase [Actinomycetota bacterium]